MMIDQAFERECEELLSYLYELAARKYGDCNDPDSLIQDTILTYVKKKNQGETVEHPKGFLAAVMKNKYNEYLRRKYKDKITSFESFDLNSDAELKAFGTDGENDDEDRDEEYAKVRREIGRLIKIYREVTVRYYMYGHSIERIASDLGISRGTVKSRLSSARNQIKEGIVKMEKYSSLSYEPKKVNIGIWGGDSIRSEPFTLLHSLIEGNILYLASVFGGAHWCYADMKYKVSLQNVGSFYASLMGCGTNVEGYMTELIPEFERLHILRRREDGEIVLDIPALTFDESKLWNEAMKKICEELVSLMGEELASVWLSWTHKIPKHVDGREHFIHDGALAVFSIAVMLAISEKKLIPYDFEVGKTPIIILEYRKNK